MRVMVGVDGSVRSERALRWGLREAAARGARMTVVYGFDVPRLRGPLNREVSLDAGRAQARHRVEAMIARAGGSPVGVPVDIATCRSRTTRTWRTCWCATPGLRTWWWWGHAAWGGFAGLLLGSVSQQVAAHAPVPVAVVPGPASSRDDGVVATRSIVVGVDGSPQATAALRWAVDSAAARRCPVTGR